MPALAIKSHPSWMLQNPWDIQAIAPWNAPEMEGQAFGGYECPKIQ
jgi:hypothetical protein